MKYWFSAAILACLMYATYAYAVAIDVPPEAAAVCGVQQCIIMPLAVAQKLLEEAQAGRECPILKDSI